MATPKLGSVLKSHKYLDTIKNNTLSPSHPRHHGVKMQAHHVISEKGIKKSGLADDLERFGYDINTLNNLVFIPSTLQGACHLGVQPHRGDHKDEFDDDDGHPTTYHEAISKMVQELKPYIHKECPGGDASKVKRIQKDMDKLGSKILDKIANTPASFKLTKVAQHYKRNSFIGCGGVDNVSIHSGKPCPCKCIHQSIKTEGGKDVQVVAQGTGQKSEGIKFPKPLPFHKLVMGK